MKIRRTEKHNITRASPLWKELDDLCFKSKNLYNYTNYIQRQRFVDGYKIYTANELDKILQDHELYKKFGSQSSQRLFKLLEKNWKSFLISIKDYSKHPNKYLGKPRIPKYKKKDGRYIAELKNIQFRIESGYLIFSLKRLSPYSRLIKTNIKTKPKAMRIIPKGSCYILEIVYEIDIPDIKPFNNRVVGIDLGVDNFATLTNNVGIQPIIINGKIIKSMNQYYNKEKAKLQSDLMKRHDKHWSNKLDKLQMKRDNKIDYYLHCASKSVVNYCESLNISKVVIGLNKTWKQESKMNKKVNQNFISIPYDKFIKQLEYKLQEKGIELIITEESYTSGCSFLDNEPLTKEYYNKLRRIQRGLFQSNKGTLINSDVNGSYNIIKKVFPDVFTNGIEAVGLHPIRVNA